MSVILKSKEIGRLASQRGADRGGRFKARAKRTRWISVAVRDAKNAWRAKL